MNETEQPNSPEISKEEIIKSIAKTLAERRQSRHVNLQAVSQRLKIRVPLLEAIENAKWEELPGEVYLKGFVLRYAQYLGLDGNKLLEPYLQVASKQESKTKTTTGESVWNEETKTSWLWITLVIIVFIVLFKFLKPMDRRVSQRAPEIDKVVSVQSISTPTVQAVPKPVVEEHALVIFSPYQLWLKITTPKKVFEGFIPENSTWSFKSEGQFQIRLGHTREVLLKFDGRQVPLFERQKNIVLPSES